MRRVFAHLFRKQLIDAISTCRKMGIGVELSLVTEVLLNLSDDDVKNIAENVRGLAGVSVHGPFRDLIIGSIDPDIREIAVDRYIETIMIAKSINAEWVLFHLNYIPITYSSDRLRRIWVRNAISAFSPLLKLDTPIHVENTYERDPIIFKEFLEGLKSNRVFMCLDIGHVNAYSDVPIEEWIVTLAPYIREVHLHESQKGKDIHAPLGSGYIDLEKVLVALENNGVKDFVITLEPSLEESLQSDINWLKEHGWIK